MAKKNSGKLALGAAIGAAAGYVAGILTAPKSGKDTRSDIKDAANKAITEAEKNLKKLHSEIVPMIDEAKGKLGDLNGMAKSELSEKLKMAQNAKEKARQLLTALHEGTADDKELKAAVNEIKAAGTHLKSYLHK